MVTKHDKRALLGSSFQILQTGGNGSHRDEFRVRDPRDLEFRRFPDVDQGYWFSGIQPPLELGRRYLERKQFGHVSELIANECKRKAPWLVAVLSVRRQSWENG